MRHTVPPVDSRFAQDAVPQCLLVHSRAAKEMKIGEKKVDGESNCRATDALESRSRWVEMGSGEWGQTRLYLPILAILAH